MPKGFSEKLTVALLTTLVAVAFPCAVFAAELADEKPDPATTTTFAIGLGVERQPSYLGAATHKTHPIPYLDINWHDQIEISTTDGLVIDLLNGEHWHGGVVGTLVWGRSAKDLGALASRVNTLNNTEQGGGYLEYDFTKNISAGIRWRHDVQSTGAAYTDVYTEFELPTPGFIEHSVKLNAAAMNRSTMRRFFGVSADVASALGTSSYQPNGGFASITATYQLFVPTSKHSGVSFEIDWSRLHGAAAQSSLVRNFGSRNQRNIALAAIYSF